MAVFEGDDLFSSGQLVAHIDEFRRLRSVPIAPIRYKWRLHSVDWDEQCFVVWREMQMHFGHSVFRWITKDQ